MLWRRDRDELTDQILRQAIADIERKPAAKAAFVGFAKSAGILDEPAISDALGDCEGHRKGRPKKHLSVGGNHALAAFKPVRVWVGLGFPRQLNTVVDAYQFSIEWSGNSPEQRAAIRACQVALAGEIDTETARGVFVAFARRKDILMEDGDLPMKGGSLGARNI